MRKFFASFLEVIEVAVVALGAVYLIRTFLVQPFLVSGQSMAPNFASGDYLLIDQITYRLREPQRGEVVVFRYPQDEATYFIKRIVGLPGDKVEIHGGKVTIFNSENPEGMALKENYLLANIPTVVRPGEKTEFSLKEGEYLVLGDNRSLSFDSREWGILPARDLVGLVRLRLWPPQDITVFAAPQM